MKIVFVIILAVLLIGCGTHGSIKGYRYPVTKSKLEKAVNTVLANNSSIYHDKPDSSNKIYYGYQGLKDQYYYNDGKSSYNDGKEYLTIKIKTGEKESEYIFRYYKDEAYWNVSPNSEIFICYAYDKNGKGGSEGRHSFRFKKRLKKELIKIFETEFISKIDEELHQKHIDDK